MSGILHLSTIAYCFRYAIKQTGNRFHGFLSAIQSRFLPRIPKGLRLRQYVGKAFPGFLTGPLVVGKSERMRERSSARTRFRILHGTAEMRRDRK
jgi:hypothetical protein